LGVDYYLWNNDSNPDVIGEITGLENPDDIFIIGAHLDAVQGSPGADDNGSGSVATLLAADLFSQYQWGCTMRFAFWTGEEQGLLGSHAYAQNAYNQGENIVGYLNLDMIAWNTLESDPYIYLSYTNSIPQSHDLALLFGDVIGAYSLDLLPTYHPDLWGSDHNSFWDFGYNSILAIEDETDFNPYYHSPQDTPAHTDPTYFTDYVKASVATFAHMSGCLISPENGTLTGTVTLAEDGSPLESVIVTSDDGQGNTYPATTDQDGNYNMLLPTDTYTVTAALEGYTPQSKMAIIVADQETVVDFALEPICIPVNGLGFTWLPVDPFNGDLITFTAVTSGTLPIDFQWDLGDTYTGTGETVAHTYPAGSYTVDLLATNACGVDNASHDILVNQYIMELYLPLLYK
jgi:hypothetical protein